MNKERTKEGIQALIFDFGDVMCFWDPSIMSEERAKSLGLPPESIRELFNEYYRQGGIGKYHSMLDFYDRGAPDTALSRAEANRLFTENEQSAHIDPHMIALLTRLKEWYKIGLLSNFPKGLEEYLIDRFHIHHLFDSVVSSYNIRQRKPVVDVYHFSAKDLGVTTEQCIFIDDREKNVRAAEEAGMKGIVFTGRKELEVELEKLLGRSL